MVAPAPAAAGRLNFPASSPGWSHSSPTPSPLAVPHNQKARSTAVAPSVVKPPVRVPVEGGAAASIGTGSCSWRQNWGGAEQAQRWLAWVLRFGHAELDIPINNGGWARLDMLAEAMGQKWPDLGVVCEAQLTALLAETDKA